MKVRQETWKTGNLHPEDLLHGKQLPGGFSGQLSAKVGYDWTSRNHA
jgi:hypothetical protein